MSVASSTWPLALGVVRGRQSEKRAGLEVAAEPPGQIGHLGRVANGLAALVQRDVAREKPVHLAFPAAKLGDSD